MEDVTTESGLAGIGGSLGAAAGPGTGFGRSARLLAPWLGVGTHDFGSVMMIVLWGGVTLAIVLAVRWLGADSGRGAGSQPRTKAALDILHERFARGEIDREEFKERKRLLSD